MNATEIKNRKTVNKRKQDMFRVYKYEIRNCVFEGKAIHSVLK